METEKNTIVLSTAYLPNLQYVSKFLQLTQSDTENAQRNTENFLKFRRSQVNARGDSEFKIVFEQHENYVKQSYRNRCEILTGNGILPLTIPVQRSNSKIAIRDVKIDYTGNWQKIHWRAITSAYRSSPFFEYYIDDFSPFFETKEVFLFDFNLKLIYKLLELIGIKPEISLSQTYEREYKFDFRISISPKTDNSSFVSPVYYQVFSEKFGFCKNLSVLDLLCNEGNNAYDILKRSKQINNQEFNS